MVHDCSSQIASARSNRLLEETDSIDQSVQVSRLSNGTNRQNSIKSLSDEFYANINTAELLYTKAGNGYIPSKILSDKRLAPLTRWAQTYLYEHQNPVDCSQFRFLVTEGYSSGFGSELHVIGAHLGHAIQDNFILVWGPSSCNKFINTEHCSNGCACLFKNLSNCSTSPHFKIDLTQSEKVSGPQFSKLIPDVFKEALLSEIPSMTEFEMRYWWRAQSVGFLMRLNDKTVTEVAEMRSKVSLHYMSGGKPAPFPLPPGTVNAHIRHGDKHVEMALVPSEKYVQAFTSLIRNMPNSFSRVLFVSADDEKAVDTCRGLTEERNMTYIYTRLPRMKGGFAYGTWGSMEGKEQRRLIMGHLLQLLMALEADAWIGTRASNWNRLIDELRCVWVDKCHGSFVELGGPVADVYEW